MEDEKDKNLLIKTCILYSKYKSKNIEHEEASNHDETNIETKKQQVLNIQPTLQQGYYPCLQQEMSRKEEIGKTFNQSSDNTSGLRYVKMTLKKYKNEKSYKELNGHIVKMNVSKSQKL